MINTIRSRIQNYFRSRSTDPDIALRERTIRIFTTLLLPVMLFSLFTSFVIFKDEFTLVSFPTLEILFCFFLGGALIALNQQKILAAGVVMMLGVMITLVGNILLASYFDTSILPLFLLILLISALVLPRNLLWPAGIVFAIALIAAAVVQSSSLSLAVQAAQPVGQFISRLIIWSVPELIVLSSIQNEFEGRLALLRKANLEVAEANRLRLLALQSAVDAAEDANRAKSQFLANMSHELRTPLNAIIGYTEIMIGGMVGTFTDKQTEVQRSIHINAKRLLSLINDILDLAKIESGTLQLFITPASPRKFVKETVDAMQSLALTKNITLTETFTDDVPETIMCDVRKVQQIITNLAGNSIKFTAQGGVTVAVGAPTKETWEIKVSDTGAGMPADAVNYIFEVFRQVDSTATRQQQGTGLGLAITKSLIDKMGGKITVDTEIGKGSTFTVTFPRMVGEHPVEKSEQEKAPAVVSTAAPTVVPTTTPPPSEKITVA